MIITTLFYYEFTVILGMSDIQQVFNCMLFSSAEMTEHSHVYDVTHITFLTRSRQYVAESVN